MYCRSSDLCVSQAVPEVGDAGLPQIHLCDFMASCTGYAALSAVEVNGIRIGENSLELV